jgi:RsmE family RNA methyltransferase
MNLILLDSAETLGTLPREDRRYTHIRTILHGKAGSTFRAGVVNGPIGVLEVLEVTDRCIRYRFTSTQEPIPPYPIEVILGAMRPIVARRLLRDLTAIGVKGIHLVNADLSEGSYLKSSLWEKNEYLVYLREGAEQGGSTLLPTVRLYANLKDCLSALAVKSRNLVMHPEAPKSFWRVQWEWEASRERVPLFRVAIGPERGWTEREMDLFMARDFTPCRLGSRVLRTEAAALVAVGILLAQWEAG